MRGCEGLRGVGDVCREAEAGEAAGGVGVGMAGEVFFLGGPEGGRDDFGGGGVGGFGDVASDVVDLWVVLREDGAIFFVSRSVRTDIYIHRSSMTCELGPLEGRTENRSVDSGCPGPGRVRLHYSIDVPCLDDIRSNSSIELDE